MITNKIKFLLREKNIKNVDYSKALKLKNPQALSTKFIRESFKAQDLIILAEITHTKLAFIDENNNPIIILDKTDIEE